MDSDGSLPRSVVAYELARRLIYHTATIDPSVSPVRSAQERLDALLVDNRLSPSEHQGLSLLLRTVEGCDLDHCSAMDGLVTDLTRNVASLVEEFPDAKLKRLAELM